jgi:hypothetical protein
MKIRTGFVSNSSSSSFVCCICGHAEEVSSEEMEYAVDCSCEHGHNFCRDHLPDITVRQVLEWVIQKSLAIDIVSLGKAVNECATLEEKIDVINTFDATDIDRYKKDGVFGLRRAIEDISQKGFDRVVSIGSVLEQIFYNDVLSDEWDFIYSIPTEYCPVCQFKTVSRDDILRMTVKDVGFASLDELVNHITTSRFSDKEDFAKYVAGVPL